MTRAISLTVFTLLIASLGISAQPLEFAFQGRLLDNSGVPISGDTTVFFSLWQGGDADTADSGTLAYSEVTTVTPDTTGIFVHHIGTGSALDSTVLEPSDLDYSGEVFLQMAVNTQSNVLIPRSRLVSVPYATVAITAALASESMTASLANAAIDSDALGGQPPSYYLNRANHTGTLSVGDLPDQVGSIWLPAWIFAPDTLHSTDPAEIWSLGVLPTLVFPPVGQTSATAVISFPPDFVPGPLRFHLVHVGDEAPTPGNDQVRWTLRAHSMTTVSGPSLNGVFSTIPAADEVTIFTGTTLNSLNSGDAVAIQIFRNAIVADDTYESNVEVLGIRVDYTRAPEAF